MTVDLIYGAITGLLRRVVVPSSGHAVARGERLVTITNGQYASFKSLDDAQNFINTITKAAPSGYRAAMIDQTGNVVSVHCADPGCDYPFPAHRLVWQEEAQPGWLFINNRFVQLPAVLRRVFAPPRVLRR